MQGNGSGGAWHAPAPSQPRSHAGPSTSTSGRPHANGSSHHPGQPPPTAWSARRSSDSLSPLLAGPSQASPSPWHTTASSGCSPGPGSLPHSASMPRQLPGSFRGTSNSMAIPRPGGGAGGGLQPRASASPGIAMSPEIEPYNEEDEDSTTARPRDFVPGSSGGSQPMRIPGSSGREGRTYRISVSPSPKGGGTGSVTVVLEGEQSPTPYVAPSSSLSRVGTFIGSLFGGTLASPDSSNNPSVQGHGPMAQDLLPHHYRGPDSLGMGLGLLSQSLGTLGYLGRRASLDQADPTAAASSVLSNPVGSLRRQSGETGGAAKHAGAPPPEPARVWARSRSYAALGAPPRGRWGDLGTPPRVPLLAATTEASASGAQQQAPSSARALVTRHSASTASFQQYGGGSAGGGTGGGTGGALSAGGSGRRGPRSSAAVNGSDSSHQGGVGADRGVPCGPQDLQDIAVVIGSLPASFGTPSSLRRNDSSLRGGRVAAALSRQPSSSLSVHRGNAGGPNPYGGASTSQQQLQQQHDPSCSSGNGGVLPPPPPAAAFPICLICLEMVAPEEFDSGEALVLECGCSGDMAVRHVKCAIEWNNAKGNTICDICKQMITNLPPVDPELLAAREEARRRRQPNFSLEGDSGPADRVFDFICIMWPTTVMALMLTNMDIVQASLVGCLAGVAWLLMVGLLRSCVAACQRRSQRRLFERQRQEQEAQRVRQQQLRQQQRRQQRQLQQGRHEFQEPLLEVV